MAGNQSPSAEDAPGKKVSYLGYFFISIFFLVVGLGLFLWLASKPEMLGGMGGLGVFIILLIISMAFAAFIFGTMQSYANYRGKQFSGNLRLSGPIVGATLVMVGGYYFLQGAEAFTNTRTRETTIPEINLRFSLKYADSTQRALYDKDKINYIQRQPRKRPKYILAPQVDHENYGEYLREFIDLPTVGGTYEAKVQRLFNGSMLIDPDRIPAARICFVIKAIPRDRDEYTVEYFCEENQPGKLVEAQDWIENCPASSAFLSPDRDFHIINSAYAAVPQSKKGWGVPSLPTLEEKHQKLGTTYTAFKITSTRLPGVEQATSYTYQIYVNGIPVYIDGLTREDLEEEYHHDKGISLEFGLENLDFSGAHLGAEKLTVELQFYSGKELLKTFRIERSYVALRDVKTVTVTSGEAWFQWSGQYVIGKHEDRYEVFIWSSENPAEISQRKERFDRAGVSYQNQPVVAVIRPPLNKNDSYGLIVGRVDRIGKIKFTFNRQDARRLLNWVKRDLRNTYPNIARGDAYVRKLGAR